MTSGPKPESFRLARVAALIGPYGAGKSEIAIGLAMWAAQHLAATGRRRVVLADLDVLKPYFRAREMAAGLEKAGVGLIAPMGALANSDLPILTPQLRATIPDERTQMMLDVGGDPVGARALGSVSDVVGAAEHDLLLVLNRYRPFMDTVEQVVEQALMISDAAHLALTGIVSNTHVMEETTGEDVRWGLDLAREVSRRLGLPLRLLGVPEHLAGAFLQQADLPPMVVVRRHMRPDFLGGVVLTNVTQPEPTRPSDGSAAVRSDA